MTLADGQSRCAIVAATLRFCAGGWVSGDDNREWLAEVAVEIERGDLGGWVCCPLCAEVVCDEHCPLRPVRQERGVQPTPASAEEEPV